MDDVHLSCSSQSPSKQLAVVCIDSPCFRLSGKKKKSFFWKMFLSKTSPKFHLLLQIAEMLPQGCAEESPFTKKSNISSGKKGKETLYTLFWKLFAAHLCSCISATSCGDRSHPHHSLNYMYRLHHEKIFAVRVPTSLLQPC